MFILGLQAIIFSVYRYFRDPQIKSDQTDSLMAQQIQWTTEANNKRFADMQVNIKDAFTLAENHTHTVEEAVKNLTVVVNDINNKLVKLTTIIEERIPKK